MQLSDIHHRADERKQFDRQWGLLRGIISGDVTNLSSAAELALVQAITKSFVCGQEQSPQLNLLVELLKMRSSDTNKIALQHAIGISLIFSRSVLIGQDQERIRQSYVGLSSRKPNAQEARIFAIFGLFSLLGQYYNDGNSSQDEISSIGKALDIVVEDDHYASEYDTYYVVRRTTSYPPA